MKICIVSEYFYPDNFLINEIAPELVRLGHEVTVLTGLPDYTTGRIPKEYRGFKKRHERIEGVDVIRVPTIARREGVIFRLLNYFSFMLSAGCFSCFWKKSFDVVLTYQLSPITQVMAGYILRKKKRIPHVIYCLDLWPASVNAWGFFENSCIYKMAHLISQWAYHHADCVAVSSRPFIEYLSEINGVDEEKLVYLPQHSRRMSIASHVVSTSHPSQPINLIFAGNIGSVQNVECLIHAVAKVETQKAFLVHIYGSGSRLSVCKQLAEELEVTGKVIFHGRVPQVELNEIYSRMDALLLTLSPEREVGAIAKTVPAKFQNYLSTGKPIIASIDGGAAEIIKETQCGLVSVAGDILGLAQNIKDFIENPSDYSEFGKRGLAFFNENYTKEIFISRLESILSNAYYLGEK